MIVALGLLLAGLGIDSRGAVAVDGPAWQREELLSMVVELPNVAAAKLGKMAMGMSSEVDRVAGASGAGRSAAVRAWLGPCLTEIRQV